MKLIRLLCVVVLVITSVIAGYAHTPARSFSAVVTSIDDGDSLFVADSAGKRYKVRLYGIDAPQSGKFDRKAGHSHRAGQPFGEAALQALRGKIEGKLVRLDVMTERKNGTVIAIVRLGDRVVNHEMVAEGMAWARRNELDDLYIDEYLQHEGEARARRLGLWRQEKPQPPWEFRKSQKIKEQFSVW